MIKRDFDWTFALNQADSMIYALRFSPLDSNYRRVRTLLVNLAASLRMECEEHARNLRTMESMTESYIKEHGNWGNCSWRLKYEKLQERLSQRAQGTAHTPGCFFSEKDGVCTCGADMQVLIKFQQDIGFKLRKA